MLAGSTKLREFALHVMFGKLFENLALSRTYNTIEGIRYPPQCLHTNVQTHSTSTTCCGMCACRLAVYM